MRELTTSEIDLVSGGKCTREYSCEITTNSRGETQVTCKIVIRCTDEAASTA